VNPIGSELRAEPCPICREKARVEDVVVGLYTSPAALLRHVRDTHPEVGQWLKQAKAAGSAR
jgi:hypothetical protein